MKKPNLKRMVNTLGKTISSHSSEIFMGVGITGMISATVMAVKATPKALQCIENAGAETKTEKVKAAWKCYIPAAATTVASTACIITSKSIGDKKTAAALTAWKLSESTFNEYKKKVVNNFGEEIDKTIRKEIAQDKVDKNPPKTESNEVIIFGSGESLCYDAISGRYFKSDIDKINKVINKINSELIRSDYISLNDFYSELGLESTKQGEELGWNITDQGLLDITYGTKLSTDGTPCIVLDYSVSPRYDYWKTW